MNIALPIEKPIILNTPIKRDTEGRYCLNDLHKASGGQKKHRPAYWLETQQAQALIEELTVAGIPATEQNQPLKVLQGGTIQGTFAIKELAIAYATWIDAKFFLVVIHTFDAIATGQPQQSVAIPHYQYTELQTQHDHLQAELLELYRFKVATLESQLDKPTRTSTPLTADEKAEILRLNSLGYSRAEIVERTGRSDTAIYYLLRHAATDVKGSAQ